MYQMRPAQLEALSFAVRECYEGEVIRHLRNIFPACVSEVLDGEIRERVQRCIPRAGGCRLTTQYDVLCFIDATYVLGEFFDSDESNPSLASLLKDEVRSEQIHSE